MEYFPYCWLIRFLPRWLALGIQVIWYWLVILALLYLSGQWNQFVYWDA